VWARSEGWTVEAQPRGTWRPSRRRDFGVAGLCFLLLSSLTHGMDEDADGELDDDVAVGMREVKVARGRLLGDGRRRRPEARVRIRLGETSRRADERAVMLEAVVFCSLSSSLKKENQGEVAGDCSSRPRSEWSFLPFDSLGQARRETEKCPRSPSPSPTPATSPSCPFGPTSPWLLQSSSLSSGYGITSREGAGRARRGGRLADAAIAGAAEAAARLADGRLRAL